MSEHILISLGVIMLLGFAAQWISWLTKIPSIVLLLIFGIVVGPILGYIYPDTLFGDVLIPFVSISVAIILFEGGLTLKLDEFKRVGKVVSLLISVGALISGFVTTMAAHWIFGLNYPVAVLLGAVLIVTGPTVIGPMLRNIRPNQNVGNILKWEGILIDPIGAILAILVFEGILIGSVQQAAAPIALSLLTTILLGTIIGGAFALVLTLMIKKYWIPDFLQEVAALTFVVAAFLISNVFKEESGLLSATIMGVVLTNQKYVPVKKIKDFKENLTVLMIPVLFILLSARLTMSDIELIGWKGVLLLIVLIALGRPLSVLVSTIGSDLKPKDKAFIAWMAPRGIVAAAVSSVFALKLAENNLPQIEYLVPITFLVIIGTVTLYGLTAPFLAKVLKISQSDPRGVLIAGAHDWALEIALVLREHGFKVVVVDTSRYKTNKAKMRGLDAHNESIIAERVVDRINLEGIGKLLALTSNDEVNALGVLHFSEIFDNENLYQLQPYTKADEREFSPQHLSGRFLFGKEITFGTIEKLYSAGATIKSTKLTKEFSYRDFKEKYDNSHIPLFLIDGSNGLQPFTSEGNLDPDKGHTIVALVPVNK
jgi:NhaP-type Na+/H+ or K+/H+ antiporter